MECLSCYVEHGRPGLGNLNRFDGVFECLPISLDDALFLIFFCLEPVDFWGQLVDLLFQLFFPTL